MADTVETALAPRSREPINHEGVRLWELLENTKDEISTSPIQINDVKCSGKIFHDKSTSTNSANAEIELAIDNATDRGVFETSPKDEVLKKWRERQAKAKHERARKAVINSLKEKFKGIQRQAKLVTFEDGNKDYIHKSIPTIVITEDVEDTSNLYVNRGNGEQRNYDRGLGSFKVVNDNAVCEVVCHARKLQMGPGGELAQWRLAPRGSRAAGAEGGLRGIVREVMPSMKVSSWCCIHRKLKVGGNFYETPSEYVR